MQGRRARAWSDVGRLAEETAQLTVMLRSKVRLDSCELERQRGDGDGSAKQRGVGIGVDGECERARRPRPGGSWA